MPKLNGACSQSTTNLEALVCALTLHCVIENVHTKHTAVVGNVCLKQLNGRGADKAFAALKRMQSNSRAVPNEELRTLLAANSSSRAMPHPRKLD